MKERYTYRWGFVFRTTDTTEYTYIYRYGFVWRVPRPVFTDKISERDNYNDFLRFYPGQIIDCDMVSDFVLVRTGPMFIRRRSG